MFPILKARSSYFTVQLSELQFFLLVLSTVMVAAAGYIINDYFDVRIDKVNKPNQLVIDKGVKRRVAMGAHMVINILAFLIGLYVSYSVGVTKLVFIHFLAISGLWFYSTTFKKQFLIGNVLIALFTAMVPFIAVMYELIVCYRNYLPIDEKLDLKGIWVYAAGISFFTFMISLVREIIKDMMAVEGDKEYGYNSMPIVVGGKISKMVIVFITLAIIVFLGYYQYQQLGNKDLLTFYYFIIGLEIPLLFFMFKLVNAQTKLDLEKLLTLVQAIMFIGICYLFVFAYVILHFIKYI